MNATNLSCHLNRVSLLQHGDQVLAFYLLKDVELITLTLCLGTFEVENLLVSYIRLACFCSLPVTHLGVIPLGS